MEKEDRKEEREGKRIKKVFICSPFRPRGKTAREKENDLKQNIGLAQYACRLAVKEGYIPYAPQLYFTQFMSETDVDEREMGILYGLTWLARCDEIWVIGSRVSSGMKKEIEKALEWDIPVRHVAVKKVTLEDQILAAVLGDGKLRRKML